MKKLYITSDWTAQVFAPTAAQIEAGERFDTAREELERARQIFNAACDEYATAMGR